MSNKVLVDEDALRDLIKDSHKLLLLEEHGCDNWCGWSDALRNEDGESFWNFEEELDGISGDGLLNYL